MGLCGKVGRTSRVTVQGLEANHACLSGTDVDADMFADAVLAIRGGLTRASGEACLRAPGAVHYGGVEGLYADWSITMSQRLPAEELQGIPGGTLITETPEEGRQLAMLIARHTIHQIQPNPDALKAGRPEYAVDPDSLTAAAQVVAIEFQTIAAANNYWR